MKHMLTGWAGGGPPQQRGARGVGGEYCNINITPREDFAPSRRACAIILHTKESTEILAQNVKMMTSPPHFSLNGAMAQLLPRPREQTECRIVLESEESTR